MSISTGCNGKREDRIVRRIPLFFVVFADTIVEVLTARVLAKAIAWELTSYESWQWSSLEDEGK